MRHGFFVTIAKHLHRRGTATENELIERLMRKHKMNAADAKSCIESGVQLQYWVYHKATEDYGWYVDTSLGRAIVPSTNWLAIIIATLSLLVTTAFCAANLYVNYQRYEEATQTRHHP